LPLRACDLECGAREAKGPLAGCGQADWGQTGGALEGQWRNSGAVPAGGAVFEQNQAASSAPPSGTGTATNAATLAGTSSEGSGVATKCTFAGVPMAKRQAVQDWLLASGTEVLAILEGQENMQGNVVQVHSHISREIVLFLSGFRNLLYIRNATFSSFKAYLQAGFLPLHSGIVILFYFLHQSTLYAYTPCFVLTGAAFLRSRRHRLGCDVCPVCAARFQRGACD